MYQREQKLVLKKEKEDFEIEPETRYVLWSWRSAIQVFIILSKINI